jgi:hypothetical protein
VPPSVQTAIACTPIVAGWLAVCVCQYRSDRRRRIGAEQWARLTAALSELDADLDRTWAAEQERIRRHW